MKAAKQCQIFTAMDRAKWPTGDDFMERSELCKKVIHLFNSKARDWLIDQPSRHFRYDTYLHVFYEMKDIKNARPTPKNSGDGFIHDVAACTALFENLEESEHSIFREGKHVSLISRAPKAEL